MSGYTPEIGWVDLDLNGNAAFARSIHESDEVTVEIWRDKALAVTSHGQTVSVSNSDSVGEEVAVMIGLGALELVAFLLLRSASRARLWRILAYRPRRGPEYTLLRGFGITVAIIGAAGTLLLLETTPWRVAVIGIATALLIYGLVRPALRRNTLIRFSSAGDSFIQLG